MAFNYEFPYTDPNLYNADWLIAVTKDTANRIKVLEDEFAKIKVLSKEEIQQMIEEHGLTILASANEYTDLKYELTKSEYRQYVAEQIEIFRVYVDEQDRLSMINAHEYSDNLNAEMKEYVDQQFIDYTYMIDPTTGRSEDVRSVVQHIVDNYLKVDSLTAGEYDAKRMSAGTYDSKHLTAYQFDFNGKSLLA